MSVSHAEPRRASEERSALPLHSRSPPIQARGEAEGALSPAVCPSALLMVPLSCVSTQYKPLCMLQGKECLHQQQSNYPY